MTARSWIEQIARGSVMRLGVYFVIGLLAIRLAFSIGQQNRLNKSIKITQRSGTCRSLPRVLAFHSFAFHPEHQGTDVKRVPQRLSYDERPDLRRFSLYRLIVGSGGNNSSWMQAWTRLLDSPFGQWLVGIVGVYVLGVGLSYLYTACIAKFGDLN